MIHLRDINEEIELLESDERGNVSDGYHTFNELYDHRIMLFILLCRTLLWDEYDHGYVWKSRKHSDGSEWPGWFIMGIDSEPGKQITYHLPEKYWEKVSFVPTFDTAPPYDGHTPADVLIRMDELLKTFHEA